MNAAMKLLEIKKKIRNKKMAIFSIVFLVLGFSAAASAGDTSFSGIRCIRNPSQFQNGSIVEKLEFKSQGTKTDFGYLEFEVVETDSNFLDGKKLNEKVQTVLTEVACAETLPDRLTLKCDGTNKNVRSQAFPKGTPAFFTTIYESGFLIVSWGDETSGNYPEIQFNAEDCKLN